VKDWWFIRFAALLALTGAAQASGVQPGPVTVTDGWFRSLPAGLPAGGYFTAHNSGARALAITGASSPACSMLMLHQSTDKGGMSGMGMVSKVDLPAGGEASFKPGGYHLMCMHPKLKVGGTAAVTFKLSDGTSVAAVFAVRDARGH
jgi:copper(I)-binding protein